MLYWMELTRALDQRLHTLLKQGEIPGVILSQEGHEAISVGSACALRSSDVIAPMHRDLGAVLVRGMPVDRVIAQYMGRVDSPTRGRDVNGHGLGDLSLGIVGYVSQIPQSMPVALGCTYAFQYRGEDGVALTYFGDGASSEGGCHETLNLASVLQSAIVFILENNQYAYSTPTRHQYAIANLVERAAAYGMPGVAVDGNDILAVHEATCRAVERARGGKGPTLIECKTLRMKGHAVHDNAEYVPAALLEEWKAKDPIRRFRELLRKEGSLAKAQEDELSRRIRRELDEAVLRAKRSPWPHSDTLTDGVYA